MLAFCRADAEQHQSSEVVDECEREGWHFARAPSPRQRIFHGPVRLPRRYWWQPYRRTGHLEYREFSSLGPLTCGLVASQATQNAKRFWTSLWSCRLSVLFHRWDDLYLLLFFTRSCSVSSCFDRLPYQDESIRDFQIVLCIYLDFVKQMKYIWRQWLISFDTHQTMNAVDACGLGRGPVMLLNVTLEAAGWITNKHWPITLCPFCGCVSSYLCFLFSFALGTFHTSSFSELSCHF